MKHDAVAISYNSAMVTELAELAETVAARTIMMKTAKNTCREVSKKR